MSHEVLSGCVDKDEALSMLGLETEYRRIIYS